MLGWHLLTNLQTLAKLKSQVVVHLKNSIYFPMKLPYQTNIKILIKSWLYSRELNAFQPFQISPYMIWVYEVTSWHDYCPIDFGICDKTSILYMSQLNIYPLLFGNYDRKLNLYIIFVSSPLLLNIVTKIKHKDLLYPCE